MLTMAYFHPWTLRQTDAEANVEPHASELRGEEFSSWRDALTTWLDGEVVSQESARYINNFLSVYRVRPRDPSDDLRSDEDVSDEELILDDADPEKVMETRVGGREGHQGASEKKDPGGNTTCETNIEDGYDVSGVSSLRLPFHCWKQRFSLDTK